MARKAKIARKTGETDITLEIDLDGGPIDVKTPIPFLDHMLANFARHGLFGLRVRAKGDIEVDLHHTVEDAGIVLGTAVKKALKDPSGIRRCGSSSVPMMDSLSTVTLDISNRPYFRFNAAKESSPLLSEISSVSAEGRASFSMALAEEFMRAFSNSAGVDMHITLHYGSELHHSIESIFKAFGRALSAAVEKDPRIKGVLSTKGRL